MTHTGHIGRSLGISPLGRAYLLWMQQGRIGPPPGPVSLRPEQHPSYPDCGCTSIQKHGGIVSGERRRLRREASSVVQDSI